MNSCQQESFRIEKIEYNRISSVSIQYTILEVTSMDYDNYIYVDNIHWIYIIKQNINLHSNNLNTLLIIGY